jgi:hypothetical protein
MGLLTLEILPSSWVLKGVLVTKPKERFIKKQPSRGNEHAQPFTPSLTYVRGINDQHEWCIHPVQVGAGPVLVFMIILGRY